MVRDGRLGIVCVALVAMSIVSGVTGRAGAQEAAANPAVSAAKASPELVGILSKELGSTPEQAAGATGSLFGVAKSGLKPGDFSQVAKAVPGMAALLRAAPTATGAAGTGFGGAACGFGAGGGVTAAGVTAAT